MEDKKWKNAELKSFLLFSSNSISLILLPSYFFHLPFCNFQ